MLRFTFKNKSKKAIFINRDLPPSFNIGKNIILQVRARQSQRGKVNEQESESLNTRKFCGTWSKLSFNKP